MAFQLKEKENNYAEAFVRLHCRFQSCEKFYEKQEKFTGAFSVTSDT